jgi:hypothetical protein
MGTDWPFDDPEDTEVFCLTRILRGTCPLLLVTHEEDDGSWQFLDGEHVFEKDAAIVCLGEMVQFDPSLRELAGLPLGWYAWRAGPDQTWQRAKGEKPLSESDWLAGTDPEPMLEWLQESGAASDRKLRLLAVACCRRLTHLMDDSGLWSALTIAERFADGSADDQTRETCFEDTFDRWCQGWFDVPEAVVTTLASKDDVDHCRFDCCRVLRCVADAVASKRIHWGYTGENPGVHAAERAAHCRLIRCIFGNPFRALVVDPRWLTPEVVGLARAIDEERAFDRMPALADALEAADCNHRGILQHCRSQTEHARGCWVVDALLGKE